VQARVPVNDGAERRRRAARKASIVAGAIIAAIVVGAWLVKREAPPAAGPVQVDVRAPTAALPLIRPPPVSNTYIGSTACRECHRDLWERYQSHPMAHSVSRVQDEPVEDYTRQPEFTRGKRTYRVERLDGKVFHHERQDDARGETIYDQAVEVHFAVGSGKRGRSYVIDRGGLLFESPISWYTRGAKWDLSPGYVEDVHQRFERRIVDRCVACHVGRAAPDKDWCDRFQRDGPFVELAIGCERCHGPGDGHVAHHRADAPPQRDDPIVNPARLPPARRESVCNQCHLHGDDVLRYGRTDFDFRPGMDVGDVWSIVVEPHRDDSLGSTPAVSQVQQMIESACAQGSAGRLGCISCHDPHSAPDESEKHAVFREKCLGCHGAADCRETMERRRETPVSDSCIACHMPRLTAADVPHATQTDHRVPRRPGAPERGRRRPPAGNADDPEVFGVASAPLTDLERRRLRGIVRAQGAGKFHSPSLARRAAGDLEPVVGGTVDDRLAVDALAAARSLEKRDTEALELWRRLLTIAPAREETLAELASALWQGGSAAESLQYLDRLLDLNPWRTRFWLQRSELLQRLGRTDDAREASRRALELDPSSIEAYRQLAELARQQGLAEEASRQQEAERRLKSR
jgi:hypothetical protein